MENLAPYTFGELLASYRRREGLRQVDMERALGVPRSYISEWESEKRVPQNSYTVDMVAKVLNLSSAEKTDFRKAWTKAVLPHNRGPQPQDDRDERNRIARRIRTSGGRVCILRGQLDDANNRRNNLPCEVIAHPLGKAQIKVLAGFFELLKSRTKNPHLRYVGGDVSYWHKEKLSLQELALQFAARQVVLDAAERDATRIANQGELSYIAGEVIPLLLAHEDKDGDNPL